MIAETAARVPDITYAQATTACDWTPAYRAASSLRPIATR